VKAVAALNSGAFALALGLSTSVAWLPWLSSLRRSQEPLESAASAGPALLAPLVDHTGTVVPRADYRRILSASTVADGMLLELCEPDRVVGCSDYSARHATQGYRYAGKVAVHSLQDVEAILTLHPDLVLVSATSDQGPVLRLRAAGIVVYDLGESRGLATLVGNIREVAALVGHPERGEWVARGIVDQLNAVAADVPIGARRRGMYLSVYGGQLFGGAKGTSYHDVLAAAGLGDAVAGYRDWPQYSTEQVLEMNPDVIVTNAGMRRRVCEQGALARISACNRPGGVVEADEDLLSDPGLNIVEAARAVRSAVYGPAAATAFTPEGAER
jgi:iron complex transport system substrate-binding protein